MKSATTTKLTGLTEFASAITLMGLIVLAGCSPEAKPVAPTPEVASSNEKDGGSSSGSATDAGSVAAEEDDSLVSLAVETPDDEVEFVAPSLNPPTHGNADAENPVVAAASEDAGEQTEVALADGGIKFMASKDWEYVKPKVNFVEYELSIPKVEGDAADAKNGRLTMMGAMGSVEANIERWHGQFKQPDGSSTADATKRTELDVNGNDVLIVDIGGIYIDSPGGPFAGGKKIERPDYRMLAAIIQAGSHGQYFVKFYGPAKTVSANEEAFTAMIKSMEVSD